MPNPNPTPDPHLRRERADLGLTLRSGEVRRPPRARHLGLRLPAGSFPPGQRPAPRLRLPRPRDEACSPRPLPLSRLRASCPLLAPRPLLPPRSTCFLLGVRGVRVETCRL